MLLRGDTAVSPRQTVEGHPGVNRTTTQHSSNGPIQGSSPPKIFSIDVDSMGPGSRWDCTSPASVPPVFVWPFVVRVDRPGKGRKAVAPPQSQWPSSTRRCFRRSQISTSPGMLFVVSVGQYRYSPSSVFSNDPGLVCEYGMLAASSPNLVCMCTGSPHDAPHSF